MIWTGMSCNIEVCPVSLPKSLISAMHFFKFQYKSQKKSEEDFNKEILLKNYKKTGTQSVTLIST
jgi:hypothetical protein